MRLDESIDFYLGNQPPVCESLNEANAFGDRVIRDMRRELDAKKATTNQMFTAITGLAKNKQGQFLEAFDTYLKTTGDKHKGLTELYGMLMQ